MYTVFDTKGRIAYTKNTLFLAKEVVRNNPRKRNLSTWIIRDGQERVVATSQYQNNPLKGSRTRSLPMIRTQNFRKK